MRPVAGLHMVLVPAPGVRRNQDGVRAAWRAEPSLVDKGGAWVASGAAMDRSLGRRTHVGRDDRRGRIACCCVKGERSTEVKYG